MKFSTILNLVAFELKPLHYTYMKINRIIGDFAPSLEEANDILAKFGWSEQGDDTKLITTIIIASFAVGLFLLSIAIAVTVSAAHIVHRFMSI